MDVINFGHGAFIAVGAFVGFTVLAQASGLDRRAVDCAEPRGAGGWRWWSRWSRQARWAGCSSA